MWWITALSVLPVLIVSYFSRPLGSLRWLVVYLAVGLGFDLFIFAMPDYQFQALTLWTGVENALVMKLIHSITKSSRVTVLAGSFAVVFIIFSAAGGFFRILANLSAVSIVVGVGLNAGYLFDDKSLKWVAMGLLVYFIGIMNLILVWGDADLWWIHSVFNVTMNACFFTAFCKRRERLTNLKEIRFKGIHQ